MTSSQVSPLLLFFFFFNDTATTEIYTLSLHDALPISDFCGASKKFDARLEQLGARRLVPRGECDVDYEAATIRLRSEEHTSELQSRLHLVCRLLLEKKKKTIMESKQTRHLMISSHATS